MRIENFNDMHDEFIQRVHTAVWCVAATVDSKGRPRTRILHPIWEGPVGWIGTHRHSYKSKHLAQNPHISLAYSANVMQPVYADCRAEWVDDVAEKKRIWDLFMAAPEPLGYDPAPMFISPDHESFGLLKLTPWRIDLVTFPAPSMDEGTKVWYGDTQ